MTDMWEAVAAAWEEEADFVDEHLADATERMLDAAGRAVLIASGRR